VRARRSISALATLAIVSMGLGVVAGPVSAGGPVTVQYPSSECPDTGDDGLQQCIDSLEAGSTVVLASEILDEAVEITKDLTLRAVDRSLQPRLTKLSIRTADTDPLRVTVQDTRFTDYARVSLSQGTGHDVRLRRLEIGKGDGSRGVEITTQVPASVTVEGSYIGSDEDDQDNALFMFAEDPDGPVIFRAIGNRISLRGHPDSASGVYLALEGDGSVRADILNNTIWDVGRCNCGAAAGISVLPNGPMTVDVNIVGNTIERAFTSAVSQRAGTGAMRLDVFNNIFSHISGPAVRLDRGTPDILDFRAGYNDYYASGANLLDGQSAGPGNRRDNPGFVDRAAGNFKLRASSPLIDKGLVCSPGGIANLDAAGRGRLAGSRVDMGAFERGAGTPTGVARVGSGGGNTLDGTSGDDILCGYGGDDTLRGKGGRDYLDGGSDDDRLTGGSGPDRSYGGSGRDTICSNDGVRGNDRADGGSGTDKGRTDSGDTKVSIEGSAAC
jgi:Ca2+-binding RTX toxin-like protein